MKLGYTAAVSTQLPPVRDEFIAASLKLVDEALGEEDGLAVRDEFIAASLKLRNPREARWPPRSVRDEFIAASLKRREPAEVPGGDGQPSAMNSSRPH